MAAQKIPVLTASFGEGHNSAARNIAQAITAASAGRYEGVVRDLFTEASPHMAAVMGRLYLTISTRFPSLWQRAFERSSRPADLSKSRAVRFTGMTAALHRLLETEEPPALISTWPVYSCLLPAVDPALPRPAFSATVVTDSITIHPIWCRTGADTWYVTDDLSRGIVADGGVPADKIEVTGFAVSPVFETIAPRPLDPDGPPRILYFATTLTPHAVATLDSLLRSLPAGLPLTIVLGRHESRLGARFRRLIAAFPDRSVTVHGWTREVPRLLASHDLVITKAGGATVHECLAAGIPAVINYMIPGQEEGNARLLEQLGCGCRHESADDMGSFVAGLLSGDGWRTMKENMLRHRRPDGAGRIARSILGRLAP